MGLKTLINSAVQSAFTSLGSSATDGLQVSISYTQITTVGTYDPSSGIRNSNTESTTVFDSMKLGFKEEEIDGEKIVVGDQKLLFPANRVSFTPSTDDYVTINSVKWSIISKRQDPAEATWSLHIRRS